jgi:bla regulator protein BlaR1
MIPAQLSPFANHLWQSTVFAGAAALLAMMLRRNRAQVRYRIWLLASAKFLIPFSLLLSAGSRIEWRDAQVAAAPVATAVGQISQPFNVVVPATATATWPSLLFLVWICGSVVVACQWWVRWQRVRAAMKNSSPLPIPGPVEVMSSQTRLEPGIFGVFRPVLLVPEGITDRLTQDQFAAILAHEFCHVRRRDNAVTAFHMVVEALFWFHPLVWWIGARIVEEREQACDEEVLREGNDPEVYAAGILKVCRFYLESPLPCASGVTGADLKKRIAAIMAGRVLDRLTLPRKLLIALVGIVAIAAPIVIGIVNAQSQTPLRFEVASIRPTKSDGRKGGLELLPGGGLRMGGVSLKMLIAMAYDVRDEQITGGPKWIGSETYNIQAKAEDPTSADNAGKTVAPGTVAWNRMSLRLQTLLRERFQLAFHKDNREASGYLLVVAKGGSKMQVSADQGNASTMRSQGQINARRGTMPMLATVLTGFLQRPVVDRTGLDGAYDYKLEYAQEPGATSDASVFSALQEQLGLKLESSRVTTTTIVIERAERPPEN